MNNLGPIWPKIMKSDNSASALSNFLKTLQYDIEQKEHKRDLIMGKSLSTFPKALRPLFYLCCP